MAKSKSSKGRQKITMEKIENKCTRRVTFSKRRNGLFKKASELCTLSGAEIAVVVVSPGLKVHSFGYPSIESVIERYEAQRHPPTNDSQRPRMEPFAYTNLQNLNGSHLDAAARGLDSERKRAELLDELAKSSQNHHWWEASINDLNLEQLDTLWNALEDLLLIVTDEIKRRLSINRGVDTIPIPDNSLENTGGHLDAEPSTIDDETSFNYDFEFAAGASGSKDENSS